MTYDFGTVIVRMTAPEAATISFPAHNDLTVRQAEDFWSDLMEGIIQARELNNDRI